MPWPLYLLIIPAALYLLFIVGPSLLSTHLVFHRKERKALLSRNLSGTYYDPYLDRLKASYERLNTIDAQPLSVRAYDGVRLYGRYFGQGSPVTALLFHGYNAAPETNCGLYAEYFMDRGMNVLLVSMRAHGESGGLYSTFGVKEQEDVLLWCEEALKQPGTEKLVLYGASMGAAAAAFASDRLPEEVKAMILDCGFTSPVEVFLPDLKRRHLPYPLMMPVMRLFMKLFLKIDMYGSARESLAAKKVPALFIAGGKDTTVPAALVREAFDIAAEPKRFLLVPGAPHALTLAGNEALVTETLDGFLNGYL